jgi:nucleotide-binding universal stress UspA family protein
MTRISRILVPTDFSATSDEALAHARRLAGQLNASLHLVHAFEDPFTTAAFAAEMYAPVPASMREELLRQVQGQLAERLPDDDRTRLRGTAEVVTGSPAKAIVEYAHTLGADLIVMGTHGRGGMAHLLLGSVAERVVRTAGCPVLTLREAPQAPVQRILVPTDFSDTSDAALDTAFLFAAAFGAELQLLHVLDDPFVSGGLVPEAYMTEAPALRTAMLTEARERLAHRAAAAGETHPPRVDTEVLFGHGAKTIAEYAGQRRADLVVMGTHGRTGVAHVLLGSVAERLVRTAPCPVITVRHARAPRAHAVLEYDTAHLPA